MTRRIMWGLLLLLSGGSGTSCAAPVANQPGEIRSTPATRNSAKSQHTITLTQDGKAMLPIVISEKASDATKAVAAELAEYLKRISGATFEVKTGDGSSWYCSRHAGRTS